jgi:hypothetical protein
LIKYILEEDDELSAGNNVTNGPVDEELNSYDSGVVAIWGFAHGERCTTIDLIFVTLQSSVLLIT